MKDGSCVRTCIACKKKKDKKEMIHICYNRAQPLVNAKSANGRGSYLCYDETCLELCAKKNLFSRAFRTDIDQNIVRDLVQELKKVLTRLKMEE